MRLRSVAVVAAVVLALGVLPASATSAGPFPDIPADSPFVADIEWLVDHGIATGYADGQFRPGASVSRQAMVTYLFRLANPGAERPVCAVDAFPDVPATDPFCGEVAWAVEQGITTGYPDGTFRPEVAVSRAAMVTFLYRLQADGAPDPVCAHSPFPDVAVGAHCGTITWAVGEGIVQGYADGRFLPGAAVSRQATAAFLHRFATTGGTADLSVSIRNLPDLVPAPVSLVSPDGERITVTSSTVMTGVPTGLWSIEAPEVPLPSEARPGGIDTYWADAPTGLWLTSRGVEVVVDYFTVVPDTTVVLPPEAVLEVTGTPTGQRTVALQGGEDVAVGDIVVAPATEAAPTGLLGRVTGIVPGTPAVITTEPVTLPEAISRGRLEFDQQISVATGPDDAAPGGLAALAETRVAAGRTVMSSELPGDLPSSFECEWEGDSLEVDTEFELEAFFAVDVQWGAWYEARIDSLSVDATLDQEAEIVLEAELEVECALEKELLERPWRLPSINVMVGPVPVSVSPQLQFFLEGGVEASARVVTGVTQSLEASVGLGFDGEDWSTRRSGPDVAVSFLPPQPQLQADASIGLRSRLSFELYGVVGPYVSVTPGLEFEASVFDAVAVWDLPAHEPAAHLDLVVNAGAGVSAGIFDVEKGYDDIIRWSRTLWEVPLGEIDLPLRQVSAYLPGLEGVPTPPTSVTVNPSPGELIEFTCLEADPPPFANGTGVTVSRDAGTSGSVRFAVVDPYWPSQGMVLRPGDPYAEQMAKINYTGFTTFVAASGATGPVTLTCESWIIR